MGEKGGEGTEREGRESRTKVEVSRLNSALAGSFLLDTRGRGLFGAVHVQQ